MFIGHSASPFEIAVEHGDCRGAVSSIMGAKKVGLSRAQALIREVGALTPELSLKLNEWCSDPLHDLPIAPTDHWKVEEVAQHEFGHLVAARALGFRTGEVSLSICSRGGDHCGSAEIFCDDVTPLVDDVLGYLRRRVMVHVAGALAQWAKPQTKPDHVFKALMVEGAESDLEKARELVRVMLNINGDRSADGMSRLLHEIALDSNAIIMHNFTHIMALAVRFAANIQQYGKKFVWTSAEIDAQSEIGLIAVPRGWHVQAVHSGWSGLAPSLAK